MANHLDLEEQEQLDQLKHFWNQYGNLITWVLIAVLGAFASWNLYHRWQLNQAGQAAALYEELERFAKEGDVAKVDRALADMKDKFSGTVVAQQAGLLAAKVYQEAGKADEAKAALGWVANNSTDIAYQSIARLRLASALMESKSLDESLNQLKNDFPAEFSALAADRKGDIYLLQGKKSEAKTEYEKAYRAFDDRTEYRRLVEVKLNSLGVSPQTESATSAMEGKK
jgi:predicted negative regulator of RcsB-dependent stress response